MCDMNFNLTEEEIEGLKNAATEDEFNSLCDKIKRVRGGQYPPDWFSMVVQSGLGLMKDAKIGISTTKL